MKSIVIGLILLTAYAEARGGGSASPLALPLILIYIWQQVIFKDKRTSRQRWEDNLRKKGKWVDYKSYPIEKPHLFKEELNKVKKRNDINLNE